MELDERWEYWTPDPEIAEVLAERRDVSYHCAELIRSAVGFVLHKGSPNHDSTRLGREWPSRRRERATKPCRRCGREFAYESRSRVFCSRLCYRLAYAPRPVRCAKCGGAFFPHRADQLACSVGCGQYRRAAQPADCLWCGTRFTPRRSFWQFCSKTCGRRHRSLTEGTAPKPVRCKFCRTEFLPKRNGRVFCSKKCSALNRWSLTCGKPQA